MRLQDLTSALAGPSSPVVRLRVRLPADDVAFLDAFGRKHGSASRSDALQRAITLLRDAELAVDYAQAFAEWADDGWDSVVRDGFAVSSEVDRPS